MAQGSHSPVAVIGAGGFLGSAIVRRWESAGLAPARFERDNPPVRGGRLADGLAHARTIYWAASLINPLIAQQRPDLVHQDREMFERFLDALTAAGAEARVVILSSGGTVYDPASPLPFTERSPVSPQNAYGRARAEIERILRSHGGHHLCVRVANAYGPGQPAASGQGVIAYWLRSTLRGETVMVYGDLSIVRDFVYVDDIAEALARVHDRVDLPEILNIGSGVPTTLGDVADAIHHVVGEGRLQVVFEPARSFDVKETWLDVSAARAALEWAPQVGLPEGIARTWTSLTEAKAVS